VFLSKGERWRYKDPWTHQKNQIEDEHKTHSMIDGDSNGARLVGPPNQISIGRMAFGGSHLPAPLHQPLGISRKLRVAPPHKILGRPTYDVGPPKVGYSPLTSAMLHYLASLPKIDYKSITSNGTRNVGCWYTKTIVTLER